MGDPATAQGWAIALDGQINIRTVSDTPRAAVVNWLVTEANQPIWASMTDDDIQHIWDKLRGSCVIVKVLVMAPESRGFWKLRG
jgi:hypothetical protein